MATPSTDVPVTPLRYQNAPIGMKQGRLLWDAA